MIWRDGNTRQCPTGSVFHSIDICRYEEQCQLALHPSAAFATPPVPSVDEVGAPCKPSREASLRACRRVQRVHRGPFRRDPSFSKRTSV